MQFPTFIDEVAFASNPLDDPQVYTDISGRASVRSFRRGRQSEGDIPDTGTSSQTFESSDRALDPVNVASPYFPNVLPMRRTRCRVPDVIPTDASLTVSGNEVTDATRAAVLGTGSSGQMMDGLSSDSSFGIRRAATNLFRRGQCDALGGDFIATAAGVIISIDTATAAPFSPNSAKSVCDGTLVSQGVRHASSTGQAAAAGTIAAGSVYFKGVAGQSYSCYCRWNNTDATNTLGTITNFTATGTWQIVTPPTVAVAAGKTGDALSVAVFQNGAGRAETIWTAHAMLEKGQAVVAPYVATSGGTTASHGAGKVQAPVTLIDETQCWIALRVRMGFSSTAGPGGGTGTPFFFDWRDTSNDRLSLLWSESAQHFQASRRVGGVATIVSTNGGVGVDSFAAGDVVTLVVRWTATRIGISINGGAFTSANDTNIPTIAATLFDIGGQIANGLSNCDVLWFACGTGALTDADAAKFAAYGDSPSPASDLYWGTTADVSMVWKADTATYQTAADAYLFTNFIDSERGWELDRVGPAQASAIAPANDAFDLLSTYAFDAFTTFPQQYAGQRVAAILDAIGWSATERDVDTTTNGQSQLQAAVAGSLAGVSALEAIQAAAGNDNGIFYIDGRGYAIFRGRHRQTEPRYTTSQATFTDKANFVPGYYLYDVGLKPSSSKIVNDYRVTRSGGTLQSYDDATSRGKYGRRTKEVSTLHVSDAEALAYAQYRVRLDKDPQRRYEEMSITPGSDPDMWLLVLTLGLGDRLTIMQSPPGGGSADVRDVHIEAISATIGPAATAKWTYRLSPANDQVGWVLGDAVYGLLGSTTVLTY